MSEPRRVIVTGASSQIGHFLLPQLVANGFKSIAVSRTPPLDQGITTWTECDLKTCNDIPAQGEYLIHIAPITLAPRVIHMLKDRVRRMVVFSSTSIFVKHDSRDREEKSLITSMIDAEQELSDECNRAGIAWTILRPTMIYGAGMDRNVAVIGRFIRRFGFFPVAHHGSGRRQPVHADDLAASCIDILEKRVTFGRSYNLPGGETLTYRDMVARIAESMGKRARIINLPAWLYKTIILCYGTTGSGRFIKTTMVDRMKQDLVFDASRAVNDFGYSPRKFSP